MINESNKYDHSHDDKSMTSTQDKITVIYPEYDGNPMSDNTQQFGWIVVIKENL